MFLPTDNFVRNTMVSAKLMKTFCSQKFPPCFSHFNFGVETPRAIPFLTEPLILGSLNPLLTGMFLRIESFLLIFPGLPPRLSAAFIWEQKKQIYYSSLELANSMCRGTA